MWGRDYEELMARYRTEVGDPPPPLGEQEDTIPYHVWGYRPDGSALDQPEVEEPEASGSDTDAEIVSEEGEDEPE